MSQALKSIYSPERLSVICVFSKCPWSLINSILPCSIQVIKSGFEEIQPAERVHTDSVWVS